MLSGSWRVGSFYGHQYSGTYMTYLFITFYIYLQILQNYVIVLNTYKL